MAAERHVFKIRKWVCSACEKKQEGLSWDYDPIPSCCDKQMEPDYGRSNAAAAVIPDEIPGGIYIRHGLCNPDGSPRKYYSKSEIAAEAQRRGLVNIVEHVGDKGSDKNKHTSRWV